MKHLFCYLLVLLFFQIKTNGQEKLRAGDIEKIEKVCLAYMKNYTALLSDTVQEANVLKPYTSSAFYQFQSMDYQYAKIMGYRFIVEKRTVGNVVETDSSQGCTIHFRDSLSYLLNTIKENEKWVVSGIDNYPVDQTILDRMTHLLDSARQLHGQKNDIRTATEQFFEEINTLYAVGHSEKLKELTSPENYRILQLDHQLDSLKGYKPMRFDLKEIDYVQMNTDSTADCRVLVRGHGGSRLNLEKINHHWVIVGENGQRQDTKRLRQKQKQVTHYKKLLTLHQFFEPLNTAIATYLTTGNSNLLKKYSTPEIIDLLDLLKHKIIVDAPYELKVNGIPTPSRFFMESDFDLKNDTVYYTKEPLTFLFTQKDEAWHLTDLRLPDKDQPKYQQVEDHFAALVRNFGLRRGYPKEPEEETAHIEVDAVMSDDAIPEEDLNVYSLFDISYNDKQLPYYPGGSAALYAFLSTNRTISPEHLPAETAFVYISFIIEKNGEITSPEIVKGVSPKLDKEALRLIKTTRDWQPATRFGKAIRYRHTLAIPFTKN